MTGHWLSWLLDESHHVMTSQWLVNDKVVHVMTGQWLDLTGFDWSMTKWSMSWLFNPVCHFSRFTDVWGKPAGAKCYQPTTKWSFKLQPPSCLHGMYMQIALYSGISRDFISSSIIVKQNVLRTWIYTAISKILAYTTVLAWLLHITAKLLQYMFNCRVQLCNICADSADPERVANIHRILRPSRMFHEPIGRSYENLQIYKNIARSRALLHVTELYSQMHRKSCETRKHFARLWCPPTYSRVPSPSDRMSDVPVVGRPHHHRR